MNNRSSPSSSSSINNKKSNSGCSQQSRVAGVISFSLYSPKLSLILLLSTCTVLIFVLIQILRYDYQDQNSQNFIHHFQNRIITTTTTQTDHDHDHDHDRLRHAVTFLPLKDLRYAGAAHNGHTWFISSMYDTQEEGEVQYQRFPSEASQGRVLCLRGRDTHDGSWNSYGLAWADSLPQNATMMKGRTFVSYNHYNYDNIWHGLSAMVPFVAWHIKTGCSIPPSRWILYHWGELRSRMSPWLRTLMEATFGVPLQIEDFQNWPNSAGDNSSDQLPTACFEEAVVMRHNEGGMSRQRRVEVYDLMRCRARVECNLTTTLVNRPLIGMTMFMRTGARSFRNESEVISIFEKECMKVKGCQLRVAYSNNLTFCQQVEVMKWTDILISPHGAQLTNMFLMDRNSSVLEFFPKGWLKLAGVGQYVYHWIASWSGMIHRGAWRDPVGDGSCPYREDDKRCMSFYKSGKIGFNETYFSKWAKDVLNDVSSRKKNEVVTGAYKGESDNECTCGT